MEASKSYPAASSWEKGQSPPGTPNTAASSEWESRGNGSTTSRAGGSETSLSSSISSTSSSPMPALLGNKRVSEIRTRSAHVFGMAAPEISDFPLPLPVLLPLSYLPCAKSICVVYSQKEFSHSSLNPCESTDRSSRSSDPVDQDELKD